MSDITKETLVEVTTVDGTTYSHPGCTFLFNQGASAYIVLKAHKYADYEMGRKVDKACYPILNLLRIEEITK